MSIESRLYWEDRCPWLFVSYLQWKKCGMRITVPKPIHLLNEKKQQRTSHSFPAISLFFPGHLADKKGIFVAPQNQASSLSLFFLLTKWLKRMGEAAAARERHTQRHTTTQTVVTRLFAARRSSLLDEAAAVWKREGTFALTKTFFRAFFLVEYGHSCCTTTKDAANMQAGPFFSAAPA